jgi:hypothetical protein
VENRFSSSDFRCMDVRISKIILRWATERDRWIQDHILLGIVCTVFSTTLFVELAGFDAGLLRPVIVVPFLSLIPRLSPPSNPENPTTQHNGRIAVFAWSEYLCPNDPRGLDQ